MNQPAVPQAHPSLPLEAKVLPFPTRPVEGPRILAAPTDAELLDRCRHSDAQAWDLLVARYERLIYTVAIRNGVTTEDAADITQTTFVALIDSLNNIVDETKLASWLMTVARRHAWRVRSRSRSVVPTDSVPDAARRPLESTGRFTAPCTMPSARWAAPAASCCSLCSSTRLSRATPRWLGASTDLSAASGRCGGDVSNSFAPSWPKRVRSCEHITSTCPSPPW